MNSKLDEFRGHNAEVFGVSLDSVHSLKAYADSMGGLNYPLLADWNPQGGLAKAVGIYRNDLNCADRTTVIVDKDGTITDIYTHPIGEDREFDSTLQKVSSIK